MVDTGNEIQPLNNWNLQWVEKQCVRVIHSLAREEHNSKSIVGHAQPSLRLLLPWFQVILPLSWCYFLRVSKDTTVQEIGWTHWKKETLKKRKLTGTYLCSFTLIWFITFSILWCACPTWWNSSLYLVLSSFTLLCVHLFVFLNSLKSQESLKQHLNPLKLLYNLENVMSNDSIIVADGGDFVGTAAYILR